MSQPVTILLAFYAFTFTDARCRPPIRQESSPQQVLSEEAALARALELSLQEVQHQEHGHIPGGGRQAAAAANTALQDTVPEDMQHMAPE